MVVNLGNINSEKKEYIQEEGYMTLKCVEVKFLKNSSNNNPIYRFTYKNKHNKYIVEDITIMPNTMWKIKQIADAMGFTYENVNILHFHDMYFVGGIKSRKHKNQVNEIVDIFEIRDYRPSIKLKNNIPKEGEPYIKYENMAHDIQDYNHNDEERNPSQDIDEDEIPF